MREQSPGAMSPQALLAEHENVNTMIDKFPHGAVATSELKKLRSRRFALNEEIERRGLLRLRSTNHPARKPAYGQR